MWLFLTTTRVNCHLDVLYILIKNLFIKGLNVSAYMSTYGCLHNSAHVLLKLTINFVFSKQVRYSSRQQRQTYPKKGRGGGASRKQHLNLEHNAGRLNTRILLATKPGDKLVDQTTWSTEWKTQHKAMAVWVESGKVCTTKTDGSARFVNSEHREFSIMEVAFFNLVRSPWQLKLNT